MRFPLKTTLKIAAHIVKHKILRTPKFAMVLQLEPLHTCNLACTGCGRVREYSTNINDRMTLEACLDAVTQCNAPMVSICGGEPLLYPEIELLVEGLLAQKRIIYICTNGILLCKKLKEYMAAVYTPDMEPLLNKLIEQELISTSNVETIRAGNSKPVIRPNWRIYWNIHLDGMERTHDMIVEREGVFRKAITGIRLAKALGFHVATNATVYGQTDMDELEHLLEYLSWIGVDGHTISPGYDYDAAKEDMIKRLGKNPDEFYLSRKQTRKKFKDFQRWGKKFSLYGTAVYQEFLAGKRDLSCTAWAIPTVTPRGWRSPCYMLADTHYPTYKDLLEKTDWKKYGVTMTEIHDKRCSNCMVHCGFDPSGALGVDGRPGDNWKNFKLNFAPHPPRCKEGANINPFNGVSAGNGHLTGTKNNLNNKEK